MDRIRFMDGWRCIAILLVIGRHYFSSWPASSGSPVIYPHGDALATFIPFEYGFYGVFLFFMVSGYVIALSLQRSKSLFEFATRRFARLFPAMALCSTLTFLALTLLPLPTRAPFITSALNFLPSLSFIHPYFFSRFGAFNSGIAPDWMDKAYWSLFVEVRFYAICAAIYFMQKRDFPRNLLIYSCIGAMLTTAASLIKPEGSAPLFIEMFFFPEYSPWFLIGVGCYFWFSKGLQRLGLLQIFSSLVIIFIFAIHSRNFGLAIAATLLPTFFVGSFLSSGLKDLLSFSFMPAVGESSYSLYLIHQNVGLGIIFLVGTLTGAQGWRAMWIPLGTATVMILLSRAIFLYFERPLNRWIPRTILSP